MLTNQQTKWWIELSQEERFAIIIKAHRDLEQWIKKLTHKYHLNPHISLLSKEKPIKEEYYNARHN